MRAITLWRAAILVVLVALSTQVFAEEVVTVGRYVRVSPVATPSQRNPLQAVVSVSFPRAEIHTLGDAARHLLQRSGYRLAPANDGAQLAHRKLVGFPLPDVHRKFEVVTILSALHALGGPSYEPIVDHVDRSVSYALRPGYVLRAPKFEDATQGMERVGNRETATPEHRTAMRHRRGDSE